MHTARLLTVSPSMHCSRRGYLLGGSATGVWLVPGGAWSGGVCLVGGVPSPGGGLGGVVSQHALRQTPPSVNRILDTRY